MTIENKIFWCHKCMVPVVEPFCDKCKNKLSIAISNSLTPVFKEEVRFLNEKLKADLPSDIADYDLWVTSASNIYYFSGKPLFKIKNVSKGPDQIKIQKISNEKINSQQRKFDDLTNDMYHANKPYFNSLKYEAESFIKAISKRYRKRTVFVSFSGGKDSEVVSNLVMNAMGGSDILHIFSDTSIEFPDTYEFFDSFKRFHPLTPVVTHSSKLDFFEVARSIGPPSRILRWCCSTHKTNPIGEISAVLNPANGVLSFEGVKKAESSRRAGYERISKKHKIGGEILARPILEWSDFDVWLYLTINNLPVNPSYKKGFRRVGCLYCPFNSYWSELLIKHYYPDHHEKWHTFLYDHAIRTNHKNPEAYANGGWRTRAGGKGLDFYKSMLESYPCANHENSYNYQLSSGDIKNVKTYIRPLGPQKMIHKDNHSESFFIVDYKTTVPIAIAEVSYTDAALRIRYIAPKNNLITKSRIEKQLKKLQSCIRCGACFNICPKKANRIADLMMIDDSLCNSCMACVKQRCPAVRALHYIGES